MKRIYLLTALLSLLLFGCDSDNGIDKSLIDNVVKLNSPFSPFTLYRYHVESSMAFGSGFTAIKILPSDEKCDFTERDFFRFGNNYPILIKWKSKDTLQVKCLGDGGSADSQPFLKEIKKWKDWTFEVEYFSMLSTMIGGSYPIDSYNVSPNSIEFSSATESLVFDNSEIAIELDSNQIY